MRVRAIVACQLFAATLASADAAAQVAKLYPVDEAARDPEFFAFRARLIVAVQKHDTAFLYSVLSEHIRISFGSGAGAAAFKERWHPEDPESRLWEARRGEGLRRPVRRVEDFLRALLVCGQAERGRRSVRLRSDYRAGFAKRNGRWVLELLVAGD